VSVCVRACVRVCVCPGGDTFLTGAAAGVVEGGQCRLGLLRGGRSSSAALQGEVSMVGNKKIVEIQTFHTFNVVFNGENLAGL